MHLFQGVADLSRALDLPLLVAATDVENRRAVGVQMGGFTCDRVEADFGKEPRREKDCFVLIVEAASGDEGFVTWLAWAMNAAMIASSGVVFAGSATPAGLWRS